MRKKPRPPVRRGRPRACAAGFTLLELLIAMAFVVLVATGIVLSITTAFRVWKLTAEQNEVNQEARAIMELLGRDLRSSYLGVGKDGGFFIGGAPTEIATTLGSTVTTSPGTAPTDTLFITTESTSGEHASFLPEEVQKEWDQEVERPISDIMAVQWEWQEEGTGPEAGPAGLYRSTAVILCQDPDTQPTDASGVTLGQVSNELISESVVSLTFQYYDGLEWTSSWDSRGQEDKLPQAVAIELELADPGAVATGEARGVSKRSTGGERKHVFRNVITLATR